MHSIIDKYTLPKVWDQKSFCFSGRNTKILF